MLFQRVLFGSEPPNEEPQLPIFVAQRGNERYFKGKTRLSSETYFRQTLQWEKQKRAVSTANEVTYGKLNVHIWGEICGNDLNSLKNHVLFPKFPSRRLYTKTTRFQHGTGNYDYGERIFGFLLPKSTGLHRFQILGRPVEIWLGVNSDPSSAKLVYQKSHYGDSVGNFELELVSNNKYYIEILHKKGSEDEDFEITWMVPGSSKFVEVAGSEVSVKVLDHYLRNGEVDSSEPSLEIPIVHKKKMFPILEDNEQQRNDLFLLPLIDHNVVKNVLTSCDYKPSYIVDRKLTNYKGVWETHYNSLYPEDKTNVTRGGWVCLGNDVLNADEAVQIAKDYMTSLDEKRNSRYKLKQILSVEKNHDLLRGSRYLLELEVIDITTDTAHRLSEYVYEPLGQDRLCSPRDYQWSRNATVNIILTVGGRQGRWVQHFINNLAEIFDQTKDQNLNVIIMDFHSKDINIEEALKRSKLPRYILLHMKSKFHKTIGLQYAMDVVTDPNDIVFICDLHLYLPVPIVDHIRKHCIQGKTAFNPLLVRLDCGYTGSNPNGRWEHDGFGPIATYKSDWIRFGGMNVERFKHTWGGEDWDLVDRILSEGLEIERLKILNFLHFYHTKKGMWKESEK
ncbi:beta-1,4-N-acetylgalactosaminyltransferase 3-like isoform X2 [Dendronephthya gigantea]|uniref:beta-1,4-N-acetylgalactosaminyltransferase 3-like isoform X2 n=1 Tax=Dendronephthya gigantea TaxID=151771 RepID=UPI00106CBBCC|nr:beta-1,4-N-acetylgalactosaminyltransferase 3-like isoform X2 [Dendronephthya gigantea]